MLRTWGRAMTETEWLACEDPRDLFRDLGLWVDLRRSRYLVRAVLESFLRDAFDGDASHALALLDRWADRAQPAGPVGRGRTRAVTDWVRGLAAEDVPEFPRYRAAAQVHVLAVGPLAPGRPPPPGPPGGRCSAPVRAAGAGVPARPRHPRQPVPIGRILPFLAHGYRIVIGAADVRVARFRRDADIGGRTSGRRM